MANPEHIERLKQGSEVWNTWREQQMKSLVLEMRKAAFSRFTKEETTSDQEISTDSIVPKTDVNDAKPSKADLDLSYAKLMFPDLSYANLSGANLSRVDLRNAHLFGADLSETNLSFANLGLTDLSRADLSFANLSHADLGGADLSFANLSGADLSLADLSAAILLATDLSAANLSATNLSGSQMSRTVFAKVDLRETKGLAEIEHQGPSIVLLHTIQLPQDGSALHFLKGIGIPDDYIDLWKTTTMYPIRYHSLFISYSSTDETLARRLYGDLQSHGVWCWFAPEDMKIGDKIRFQIDEAIHQQDKLLLILSAASVASDWVEHEVEMALAKERKEQRTMLFPIRVDRTILDQEDQGWPALVRYQRHIGDFTNWTDPQAYQIAFKRLLDDLKKTDELAP